MPLNNTVVEQLSSTTLAAKEAAKQEDWKQLSSLLKQRSHLIDQISKADLTAEQIESVKKADFHGRELSAILAKQVKEAKVTLGEGTRARSAAKNYRSPHPSAAYDLTG